jgi:hypothetical protein
MVQPSETEQIYKLTSLLGCIVELGTGHYLWGVASKRNVFRGKHFADPIIKKSKI